MEITNKSLITNIILFGIYFIISIITFTVVSDFLHIFLIWNLFLAIIPFLITYLIDRNYLKSKLAIIIALLTWLFFFPNSIYIITDLIYINYKDFINMESLYTSSIYLQNLPAYLALFHIYLGSIIGFIYGFKSINTLYNLSKKTVLGKYRDLITIAVFGLSGFGIYIGRFFRYNSWEFFKVFSILKDFFTNFSVFTVFFILGLTLIQALVFYSIRLNFKLEIK